VKRKNWKSKQMHVHNLLLFIVCNSSFSTMDLFSRIYGKDKHTTTSSMTKEIVHLSSLLECLFGDKKNRENKINKNYLI